MKFLLLYQILILACALSSCQSGSNPKRESRHKESYSRLNTLFNHADSILVVQKFSGSILVRKDGKTILKKSYGLANMKQDIPYTDSTFACMGSITKHFTTILALKYLEEGKLKLTDSLVKYFKNIPDDKKGITVHHLLSHSSGLPDFLENDGGDYFKVDKQTLLKKLLSSKLIFKPGEKGVYSNMGITLMAAIIEEVSGISFEQCIYNNLFKKNGIAISYNDTSSMQQIAHAYRNGEYWGTLFDKYKLNSGGPYWNLIGNGGLYCSINEIEKWSNLFWEFKVLSKKTVHLMHQPKVAEQGSNNEAFFGYGCLIEPLPQGDTIISNNGSNQAYYATYKRIPHKRLEIFLITNQFNKGMIGFYEDFVSSVLIKLTK